jgi:hypothetical protein
MFEFLRRLGKQGSSPEDDAELQQEMQDEMDTGAGMVQQLEAAGTVPVLETQHRAIGTDTCHAAVPASMPDRADAYGKLFLTNRRVIFSGSAPLAVGLGRIIKAERQQRDVVIVSGGEGVLRFRCNSFGDAMTVLWILERLRTGTAS